MGSLFSTGAGTLYPAAGGSGTSLKLGRAVHASGSYAITATGAGVFVELDSSLRLTVPATAGDWVWFGFQAMKSATAIYVDVASMVGGSPARFASSEAAAGATEGLPSWYPPAAGFWSSGGNALLAVAAGDLTGANLIASVFYAATQTGTIFAEATYPFRWWAVNLGKGT